jgi:hypothetical protein
MPKRPHAAPLGTNAPPPEIPFLRAPIWFTVLDSHSEERVRGAKHWMTAEECDYARRVRSRLSPSTLPSQG